MKVPISVIITHCLILIAAIYIQPAPIKVSPRPPVKVKTVVLAKEQFQIAQATPPPPIVIPEPLPEPISEPAAEPEPIAAEKPNLPTPQPTPKNPPTLRPRKTPIPDPTPKAPVTPKVLTQKKTEEKKSIAATKKPTPPQPNPNHDKLIAMMQKSLNTLNTGTPSKTSTSTSKGVSGKTIGPLASEALSFEAKYEEELVSYLEALLAFPEKGDVKLKLTLKREGSLQAVEILKASSTKNRSYVETSLASCSFPPFGTHFKGETTHTFTLNLTCTP